MKSMDNQLTVDGKGKNESKAEGGKSVVAVPREVAERWAGRLLEMYTPEQVDQLLEVMMQAYDNAVIREHEQTFTVVFGRKGFPIGFGGTNDVKPVKPKTYAAE